jgi:hypothetical protein
LIFLINEKFLMKTKKKIKFVILYNSNLFGHLKLYM